MDWNTWLQFTGTGLGAIFAFAALFAGLGYFKQGRTQSKLDTVNLFKEQVDALETKVNTQSSDIERMTKEIHDLKVGVEERDKKIVEFMQIFQGRDPQTTAFIEVVRKYIESNIPMLENIKAHTIPTIEQLQKYLDKQSF